MSEDLLGNAYVERAVGQATEFTPDFQEFITRLCSVWAGRA